MVDRMRWLLLSHEGRVVLAIAYLSAGLVAVVTYWAYRGPLYALAQAFIILFGLWWVSWCVRRR